MVGRAATVASAERSSTGTWSRYQEVDRQVEQDRIVTVERPGTIKISTRVVEQRGQCWARDEDGIPVASDVGLRN
ncbi:MAG: hypothetical protein M3N25_00170 [Actinomycetota bacterium]|nr:hypothetical protein [Actinomycetota bacterium]MDP9019217.1 hypothetical protein [Actinomycetota bacterium]